MLTGPEAEAKLKSDPKTAKYFGDPQFNQMWTNIKQQPSLMMKLIQQDQRLMDCFQVLTGIDLMDIREKEMKAKAKEEDE